MNRIDRVSAILVQLQSRSLVKAQQIAERFDISLRTVYRDIRTLEDAGIPIVGSPGIGYSLMDGFKLPPLIFTQEEAIAFLTAEKLVNELADSGSSRYYKSGMEKIRAVLRFAEKDLLENMETTIGVLKAYNSNIPKSDNFLQSLLRSISLRKVVRMTYISGYKQETLDRDIEPVGVFFSRVNWYLIAFCRTRTEYRTFRIERIQNILQLDESFISQHPPLSEFLENLCKKQELDEVVIRLKQGGASIIRDDKYYQGLFSEKETEEGIELSFLTFSLDKFARWYLSYADISTIIKPQLLKDKVRSLLENISISLND